MSDNHTSTTTGRDVIDRPVKRGRGATVARSVQDTVVEVLQEDFNATTDSIRQSIRTQSWAYPIRGFFYLIHHPSLWWPLMRNIPSLLLISAVVLTFAFSVIWIPTMAVALFITGPLAIFSATFSVLALSSTLIQSIAMTYVLPTPLVDIFDQTLIKTGHGKLVGHDSVEDVVQKKSSVGVWDVLKRMARRPGALFSKGRLVRRLLYAPVNMVPVVGPVFSMVMQARISGGECHDRYFELKKWDVETINAWVTANRGSYAVFALISGLCQIIPIFGFFFHYTSTVGAALWAADIEDKKSPMIRPGRENPVPQPPDNGVPAVGTVDGKN